MAVTERIGRGPEVTNVALTPCAQGEPKTDDVGTYEYRRSDTTEFQPVLGSIRDPDPDDQPFGPDYSRRRVFHLDRSSSVDP